MLFYFKHASVQMEDEEENSLSALDNKSVYTPT